MALVWVNGELLEPEHASISVFDHGLVVGDGVFETVIVHRGTAFCLARHLDRLERSAAGLGIACPDRAVLEEAVGRVVDTADSPSARLRITLTSGSGVLGSPRTGEAGTLVVALGQLGEQHPTAAVWTVPFTRNEHGALVGLKTTSYGENALALAIAERNGADEALFANTSGELCEGTGSNVFVVVDGELLTPPLRSGCLAGVTRALLLGTGFGTERDIPFDRIREGEFEEAFLTSTLRAVQAVRSINGRELDNVPGPMTKAAAAAYEEMLAGDAER